MENSTLCLSLYSIKRRISYMEFKKSVMLPLALSIIGIFCTVATFILVQIGTKVSSITAAASPVAILQMVLFILFLTSLSAKKPIFARVVSIIAIAVHVFALFIVTIMTSTQFQIYETSWDTVLYLIFSVLCLVALILFMIYYIIGRRDLLMKLALFLNVVSIVLVSGFAIICLLSGIVGIYRTNTMLGIEYMMLLLNVVVLLVTLLLLQKTLGFKEEK